MNKLSFIILIAVSVVVGLVACALLGRAGIAPFDGFYTLATGWISGTDLSSISNPASIITTVGAGASIAGAAGALLSKAKTQVSAAQTQVQSVTSKLTETSDQLETVAADKDTLLTKLSDTETLMADKDKALSTAQTQADTYKAELDRLQTRYSVLQQTRAAEVIGSLPGGTIITNPNGSTSAIVEKVVIA